MDCLSQPTAEDFQVLVVLFSLLGLTSALFRRPFVVAVPSQPFSSNAIPVLHLETYFLSFLLDCIGT